MIVPSPEIAAIADRFVKAEQMADGATLEGLLLDSEHLRYIGTAADEVWAGRHIRANIARHVAEIPPYEIHRDRVDAFECGPTGWAEWIGKGVFEGRAPRPVRFSLVFVLHQGHWMIAHCHISFPVANEEVGGFSHTAINQLLASLEAGDLDLVAEGEVTILFTDIADSTAIAAALGDKQWSRTISRHLRTIGDIVEGHGGQVVKTLGDGAMASFPTAAAALDAAVAMQRAVSAEAADPKLRMRIGLHCGEVIETAGDFFGTVVNKAARIAAAARPGQILVSDVARAEGGEGFDFRHPMHLEIRGLTGVTPVSSLRWDATGPA